MAPALGLELPPPRRVLEWWTAELKAMLPSAFRGALQPKRPEVVLAIEGDLASVIDAKTKAVGRSPSAMPLEEAVLEAVARARKTGSSIEIRVPWSQVFSRRVSLPSVSKLDIPRMLLLDLERSTPFKAADVLATYVEVPGQEASTRQISLLQLVLKRKTVDPVASLVAAAGGQVGWIGCWNKEGSAPLPSDFAPPELSGNQSGIVSRLFAPICILLLVSAPSLYVYRQHEALDQLRSQVDGLRGKAGEIQQSITKAETLAALATNLEKLQRDRTVPLSIIEHLSQAIPDHTHLTNLRITPDAIEISGSSTSAAELPQVLERSGRFTDALLTSPVTIEGRDGRERFSIKARYKKDGENTLGGSTP